MRSLEASRVVYTSDAIKCTVVRAEGLPAAARKKPCIVEAKFGGSSQCTGKRKPGMESGAAEYDSLLLQRCLDHLESLESKISDKKRVE